MGVQSSTVTVMYTLYVPNGPFSTATVIGLLSEPIVYTPLSVKFPEIHYKNMPILIYSKFYKQKNENVQIKNSDVLHKNSSKHRLWVLIRTASAK